MKLKIKLFDETKNQESYISNRDSSMSNPMTINKFLEVFESNLILMLDWGWLTVCFI